jgi:hypothetical protein
MEQIRESSDRLYPIFEPRVEILEAKVLTLEMKIMELEKEKKRMENYMAILNDQNILYRETLDSLNIAVVFDGDWTIDDDQIADEPNEDNLDTFDEEEHLEIAAAKKEFQLL